MADSPEHLARFRLHDAPNQPGKSGLQRWRTFRKKSCMPSTHLSLHYHLVFGTKDHAPIITPALRPRLHAYLGGVINTLDGVAEAVGGASDHVHVLVGLRATHCLADVLCKLKAVSSRWVHEEEKPGRFAWQEGYAAFTVSASQCAKVRAYINRQETHHRRRTFREEYMELLRRSSVDFDEKYVF